MSEKKCGRRRGLFGDTELERDEIRDRQETIRANWSTETELIRRVVQKSPAVLPQQIFIADLVR